MNNRLFLLLLACALLIPASQAQTTSSQEVGRPFLTNYEPNIYGAHPQNWDVVQDHRGVMYFGNASGVLEYDGTSWRLISLPNQSVVRSLDIDEEGRIWVGGLNYLGYLAPDAQNQLQFVSMLEEVPEEHREFNDVWQIHITPDGIYFNASSKLFRWQDGQMHVILAPTADFHMTFWVNGIYYARQWEVGLMKVEGDALVLVPGGEAFALERIYVMVPYDEEQVLVGTRTQGFFLFNGTTFTPFRTEVDAFFQDNALYQPGTVLSGGRYALGAISGGAVIIDKQGRLVQTLDRAAGLQDNTALYTYLDHEGALWLGLDNGITRVDLASPLTRFGEEAGLTNSLFSVRRHAGRLIVGTNTGALWLDPAAGQFLPIDDVGDQVYDLLSVNGQLLAGSFDGVHRIDRGRAETVRATIANEYNAFVFHHFKQDPSRIAVGLNEGISLLRYAGGAWIDEGSLPEISQQVWTLAEDANGDLWAGAGAHGVFRIHFPAGLDDPSQAEVERFGVPQGMPDGTAAVFIVQDQVYAIFKDGTFRFDRTTSSFAPDTTFASISRGGDPSEYVLKEDGQGRIWISFGQEVALATPLEPEGFQIVKVPFRSFSASSVYDIYPEEDGVVWFASAEGLFRYDAGTEKDYAPAYTALIRGVTAGEDSLLYGGALATAAGDAHVLDAALNALRFDFGTPFYEQEARTQYQTFLEGFDEHPSTWGGNTYKEYTNLPPGDYTFRAKAKNLYEHESTEATFAFTILPPWYRTTWAYVLYALLLGLTVFGADRIQRKRLLKKEHERRRVLEGEVEARTAEIQQRVEELAVINSVQEGLVAELDMQAIYDLVGNRIRDLFDAQVVIIATYDHDAEQQSKHYILEKGQRFYSKPSPFNNLHRHLIKTREPVLINEGAEQAMRELGLSITKGTEMPRSLLFVPMVVGDSVKGYISLQNADREHAFSDSDVRLLTTLANSMSVALENARLFDETTRLLAETEQRAAELDTVNHISRALVAQLEFDALVQLVGEQIRETFRASIVYVALHDRATNMVHFPYEYGDQTPSRPFGSGLTEKVITTRESLLINRDLEEVRDQLQAKQIGKVSMSYVGVPIIVGEEAIGVISVQSTEEEGRFDADDMRLLTTIAANVGVALQNAEAYQQLNATVEELKTTQQQLVTQEKLASLGQLTAGVAHEIKNPLNFVNNFADLNVELSDELREEIQASKDKRIEDIYEEITEILTGIKLNAAQIRKHGKRADAIVKNMMEHASGGAGERYRIEVNTFVEEYIGLAYHGARGKDPEFTVEIERDYGSSVGTVEMVPQEIGRVLVNLLNNAFDAVRDQAKQVNGDYIPTVGITTQRRGKALEIQVADNGPGIPADLREKIFEPFFTTKPTGSGTGLGLSLSYDIITQGHGGKLSVESTEGKGSRFVIVLPA